MEKTRRQTNSLAGVNVTDRKRLWLEKLNNKAYETPPKSLLTGRKLVGIKGDLCNVTKTTIESLEKTKEIHGKLENTSDQFKSQKPTEHNCILTNEETSINKEEAQPCDSTQEPIITHDSNFNQEETRSEISSSQSSNQQLNDEQEDSNVKKIPPPLPKCKPNRKQVSQDTQTEKQAGIELAENQMEATNEQKKTQIIELSKVVEEKQKQIDLLKRKIQYVQEVELQLRQELEKEQKELKETLQQLSIEENSCEENTVYVDTDRTTISDDVDLQKQSTENMLYRKRKKAVVKIEDEAKEKRKQRANAVKGMLSQTSMI